jgi:CheY-like chemotaxis protein
MIQTAATILIIDDSSTSRKFTNRALTSHYSIEEANNALNGLKIAEKLLPDAIVMDVEMPGMNGYAACEQLRRSTCTQHIPVVFISSLSTLRSRMQGYEAGGDDFLVKPFEKEELLTKLQLLIKQHNAQEMLSHQADDAQKTAYQAMSGNHELGQAMLFIEQCQDIKQFSGLAKLLFQFAANLGINCSLLIRGYNDEHRFSCRDHMPPLESELIHLLRDDNRFHDFGSRTQINFPQLSLLVKNMPLDDMDRYGRIKDLLPSLLGTLNARVIALNTEHALEQQTLALMASFNTIQNNLQDLGCLLHNKHQASADIMQNMLNSLAERLPSMGLEDDQETYILNHIESAIESSEEVANDAEHITETFDAVLTDLQQLVDAQNQLVITLSQSTATASSQNETGKNDEGYSMDVELF